MTKRDILVAFSLSLFVLAISLVIWLEGYIRVVSPMISSLGESYLYYSYNPWYYNYTSFSLNVVSAIIWDYRGLDTFFETCVLLASILILLALFRGFEEMITQEPKGLSIVAKTATKLVIPLIIVYGLATALHGQLTPGGGFQGGAILAVVSSLIIAVYSLNFLYQLGLKSRRLVIIRGLSLIGMILIAIIPLITGFVLSTRSYVFQNMSKEDSIISMPSVLLDAPLAGSIFFYNVFELLVVFSGLTTALILLSLREIELKKALEVEEFHE